MDKNQVLNNSDEAAKFVTNIEGWVDRHGRFWGKDERMARWSGCTHILCPDCGATMGKDYTRCKECRNKSRIARYNEKEKKVWDGETILYSELADTYFSDEEDLDLYAEEFDVSWDDLRLVICEPNYLATISDDYWCDVLPEDISDLPVEIADALDEFNGIISNYEPVSWSPGKYAAIMKDSE